MQNSYNIRRKKEGVGGPFKTCIRLYSMESVIKSSLILVIVYESNRNSISMDLVFVLIE